MKPAYPKDKRDLAGMIAYRDYMRAHHTDRFEVYRIEGGYEVLQDIPGDGDIFENGRRLELL